MLCFKSTYLAVIHLFHLLSSKLNRSFQIGGHLVTLIFPEKKMHQQIALKYHEYS